MGILGLTHDENGVALERLPVTIKVAIGEGPEPGSQNGHPRRLDHFVFKRKTLRGQDVVWEPAPEIAKLYGEKPTELGIIFLNDDPREVLRTEYAWWTPAGYKCHGDLVQIANGNEVRYEMRAVRRTQKHPEGEPWPGNYKYADGPKKGRSVEPCGEGCPDLERGDCKPSGDLYFILEKFPTLGAVCRLHTSSYRSIRNLSNGLMQIRRFNGGRLVGIKAVLKATPEKIWYSDRNGARHSSVVHILSLEMGAANIPGFTARTNAPVRVVDQSRPAVGPSRGVQYAVHETDAERAKEIAVEFYPDDDFVPVEHVESPPGPSEEDEQLARIGDLARRLGYNEAKTKMKLGQWAGNLVGLEGELSDELDAQADRPGPTNSQAAGEIRLRRETERETTAVESPNSPCAPAPPDEPPSAEGFLF
jgi:Recombination directionality factor-like